MTRLGLQLGLADFNMTAIRKRQILIPEFKNDGLLPAGIHKTTGDEFVRHFCNGPHRQSLSKAITDLLDFATARGANDVVFGGSFVTTAAKPSDIDCMIVFDQENQIPDHVDRLELEGTKLDIFYASLDQPALVSATARLLSENRRGRPVGVVSIPLRDEQGRPLWEEVHPADDQTYEIIKRAYTNRQVSDRSPPKLLVTVHGIKTYADWNAEVCHIASSRGWIVAPFVYGKVGATVFTVEKQRLAIVEEFRQYVADLTDRYHASASVISHSFGTYIVAKYLLGFDHPPVSFDTWILSGAVLDPNLNLDEFEGKAFKIIHEVAPNDNVVDWANRSPIGTDPLFGNAGRVGFNYSGERLVQRTCDIFEHTNVIRRDVVAQRWLPWLDANVGLGRQEAMRRMLSRMQSDLAG